MRKNFRQVLCSVFLTLFFICGLNNLRALAQADDVNSLYYKTQYSSGVYTNAQYDDMYVSYNDFYQNLAPYGQWIEDRQYGYVFIPDVDPNFRPYYTNGHWAMTDYGNTWISEYNWGWACFHYGRWTFDPYYGWMWIPGSTWGPAWVSWRVGNGFYGWAPLAPGYEFNEAELNVYKCPGDWWVFLPPQYLYGGNYYRYWDGPRGNGDIIKNTTYIENRYNNNNITYVAGPRANQVEAITHQPVQIFHLNNTGAPRAESVHLDIVKMFRPPEIKAVSTTGERITPPNVVNAPHPIAAKPQAINNGAGAGPSFKNDIPAMPREPRVINVVENKNNNHKSQEAQRADNYPYQSELKSPDPQKAQGGIIPVRKTTLPPQGAQQPEPVYIPMRAAPKVPAPTQHADEVPRIPQKPAAQPQPTPRQRPEPIKPTEKKE